MLHTNLLPKRVVSILRNNNRPLPFKAAKRISEKEGYLLISNRLADALLHSYMRASLPVIFWTGTIVAYPASGTPFKSFICYTDPHSKTKYVLDVPNRFVGRENCALVMMPDAYLLGPNGRKFTEYFALSEPIIVPHFPNTGVGSFGSHGLTQIPVENGEGKKRELWRALSSEYVGPVVRMHANHEGENWRDNIYICLPPSKPLPVVVEKIKDVA